MSCAAPRPSLRRWRPTDGGTVRVQQDRVSLFARSNVHQKAGNSLPTSAFRLLDHITVGSGIGPEPPAGCAGLSRFRETDGIDAGLDERPTLASSARLIQLMAIGFQPGIH